nr:MAG TPA: Thiamine pyridinylase I [Microviridae sp.]
MLEWRARFLSFFHLQKNIIMATQKNSVRENLGTISREMPRTRKMTKNRLIAWIVLIVAVVVVSIFASCTASHRVSQSASTFRSGDTLTTTIIYQQTGKFKK